MKLLLWWLNMVLTVVCGQQLPTSQPTVAGIIGRDWFITVATEARLFGSPLVTVTAADQMPQVAAAFLFAVKELLSSAERAGVVQVAVAALDAGICSCKCTGGSRLTSQQTLRAANANTTAAGTGGANGTSATAFALLRVTVWCNSTTAGGAAATALDSLSSEPLRLLLPLHERGLQSVTSFALTPPITRRTAQQPPEGPAAGAGAGAGAAVAVALSPFRIVWIILGAVGGFTAAVCVLGSCVSFFRRHPTWPEEVQSYLPGHI